MAISTALARFFVLSIGLACPFGCGSPLDEVAATEENQAEKAAICTAYLLDLPNFSGPLAPFPVVAASGVCVNLPPGSDNRTSSFRLAGCSARFFDATGCTGTVYSAGTSGVMPVWFDNRTTSLMLF